jgi:hypothetical protein
LANSKLEIRENPGARKMLEKFSADDTQSFAELVLMHSREVCPVAEIKGGTLKQSLEKKVIEPKVIELRSRTGYGGYVHFGTSKMVARPYFAWGTDAAVGPMKALIAARGRSSERGR